MNTSPMYHIIIHTLTCRIVWILVPRYGFLTRSKMAAVIVHERKTAVAMHIIDQLSTHIYVYVDNYQNKIYFVKKKEIVCAVN